MARKPKPAAPEVIDSSDAQAFEQTTQAVNTLAVANSIASAEKDEVLAAGIDIGRLEALDFVATVANSAILPIYENVKKSKAWKHLTNPKSSNGSKFESLEEFCEVKLGKTYGRMQHLLVNRNLIGQEAFEQAEKLGLRQIDYNAIKALPAPEQELMRRAVEEAQSRDEVLDVLQELAGRFVKTEANLSKQLEDTQAELASVQNRSAENDARANKYRAEAESAKKRIANADPEDTQQALLQELTARAHKALAYVRGDMRLALQALQDTEVGDAPTHRNIMAGFVNDIQRELDILRTDFYLHAAGGPL